MKLQWNILCESLAVYGDLISKTLKFLPATRQTGKIKKHLAKEWEQITKIITDIDQLIDPENPVDIEYMFSSDVFKTTWQYYKDYLLESHNMTLKSRVENSRLKQLYRFSGKDESRALLILELLVANNYRNIICPSEKQLTGEEQADGDQESINLSIK